MPRKPPALCWWINWQTLDVHPLKWIWTDNYNVRISSWQKLDDEELRNV
jgi:hypothetical protein